MDGIDKADIVNVPRHFGKQFADMETAFPVRFEFPGGLEEILGLAGDDPGFVEGDRFAVVAGQLRFVVKGVHLRGTTMHEEKNDPFGPG